MSYVAVGVLFLLIASGFITYLVLSATKKSANPDDGATPRIGSDETPFGDTGEHAGSQDPEGHTVDRNDAGVAGGTGHPTSGVEGVHARGPQDDPPEGRFKRDPIGGEAESEPSVPVDKP